MLSTVYAHRVEGEPYLSRWQPFKVYCTESSDHTGGDVLYWVKVRRDRDSAAVQISEVFGLGLAAAMGFRTHSAALVVASEAFAVSVNAIEGYPSVRPGPHFGTRWLDDVIGGTATVLARYAAPADLVRLWVLDCWLQVKDRLTFGNVLFAKEGGTLVLIPSDHSDCFGGAGYFTAGGLAGLRAEADPVQFYPGVEQHVLECGSCAAFEDGIERAREAAQRLEEIASWVPSVWWGEAELSPGAVVQCLRDRAHRLDETCMMSHWKGVRSATERGKLL